MWFEIEIPQELTLTEKELFRAYVGFAYDRAAYFGQYESAVNIIVKTIYETRSSATLVCHPLLYLMRHSIELGLKMNNDLLNEYSELSVKKAKQHHDLKSLFNEFKNHFNAIVKTRETSIEIVNLFLKDSKIAESLIEDLRIEDAAFRYPDMRNGQPLFEDTSVIIDILDVLKKYRITMKMLSCIVDTIEIDFNRSKMNNVNREKGIY